MTLTSIEAKWISMLIVGVGSLVIGVIPICYIARGRVITRKLILSALLCFGGGVLLATSVLHILPETRELLPNYAELIFCCGFLLLYFIDEIVHYFRVKDDVPNRQTSGILTLSEAPTQNTNRTHQRTPSVCLYHGLPSRGPRYQEQSNRRDIYEIGFNSAGRNIAGSSANEGRYEPTNTAKTNRANAFVTNNALTKNPRITKYGTLSPTTPEASSCCTETETFLCHGNHTEPCADTNTGHVGLSLALTLHAILEGLAIGLQRGTSQVLLLAGAVVSHKFVVAFCLGLELAGSASTLLRNILAVGLFAGGSAVGIGIGMLAIKALKNSYPPIETGFVEFGWRPCRTGNPHVNPSRFHGIQVEGSWAAILMPVLQGLAGGTLLYVTVSEVLPRERARWHSNARRSAGLIQFFSVAIGFSLIYCLNRYLDSHHDVLPRQ